MKKLGIIGAMSVEVETLKSEMKNLTGAQLRLFRPMIPEEVTSLFSADYDFRCGVKILGAGGGGFLLFYVKEERQEAVRAALADLVEISFSFESGGSQVIFQKDNFLAEK